MAEGASLSRPERQWRAAIPLGWPMAIGATTALMALDGLPVCAFRHLSGQPCPLCGATHACAALLDGNLAAAWQANPGLLPLVALAAIHTVTLSLEALAGRRIGSSRPWRTAWTAGLSFLVVA